MHTLPLPEVTEDRPNTKLANGNSKLDSADAAPRSSNLDLQISAAPRKKRRSAMELQTMAARHCLPDLQASIREFHQSDLISAHSSCNSSYG